MSMHNKVSGAWQEVTDLQVKVSGTWREVTNGYVKVSGTWQEFYTRFAFSSAPSGAVSAGASGAPLSGTVDYAASVTITGGTPPYTYSWGRVSVIQGVTQQDIGTNPETTSSTSHSITIRGTSVPEGTPSINSWQIVVEDNDGNSITSNFTLTLTWTSTA